MNKIFKNKIIDCLELCSKELYDRKNGIKGESTVEQLEKVIIPELQEILINIDNNNIPKKEDRYLLSFANAFRVWDWNMQFPTELFIQLKNLNDSYKNL